MAAIIDNRVHDLRPPDGQALALVNAIHAPDNVFEIRALGVGGRDNRFDSGYFDDRETAVRSALKLDSRQPRRVFTSR